jgi:P-type E1-E2 ATPase
VAFITFFSATTNYFKEKQFLKLYEEIKQEEVSVIRGQSGLSQPVRVFDVVPGDVVIVEAGSRVPADCLLIDGLDITVDEGMYHEDRVTIVKKSLSIGNVESNNHTSNPDPFLLSKSLVMSGSGRAVICAVGHHT